MLKAASVLAPMLATRYSSCISSLPSSPPHAAALYNIPSHQEGIGLLKVDGWLGMAYSLAFSANTMSSCHGSLAHALACLLLNSSVSPLAHFSSKIWPKTAQLCSPSIPCIARASKMKYSLGQEHLINKKKAYEVRLLLWLWGEEIVSKGICK